MKKLLFLCMLVIGLNAHSQVYNPATYYYNGTPSVGVKIKTNIPFYHGVGMPTIIIEGFNYGDAKPIGLILNWYVYGGNFYSAKVSSFGAHTPVIKIGNENEKVVIYIDERKYFNRFNIRAFAQGKEENDSYFQGWTIVDEALTASYFIQVPYENSFAGNINFPGGVWKENGDVGIGTSIPYSKLSLQETINSTKGFLGFDHAGINTWKVGVFDYNTSSLVFGNDLGGAFNNKILTLSNSGKVGIGTTNPQNLLDVNGTIHAREVKVDLTGWSDFVFHPSYQLKPLAEVEKFIKTNGHLQDIPSAAEVEQNGVNVGEMQKKLLQKVEELTLYVIELKKENESLREKILNGKRDKETHKTNRLNGVYGNKLLDTM